MSNEVSVQIPSILAEIDVGESAVQVFEVSPYVVFLTSRSKIYPRVVAVLPSLQEGEPVLIMPEPDAPVRLDPFKFFLVHHFAHYSRMDDAGTILGTTLDPGVARTDKSYKEHVEAVVLVVHGDRLIPARTTFRTTKAKAGWAAVRAIELAKSPKWSQLSPEHEATLVVPDPRFRFTTTVKLSFGQVSRSSANKFTVASGVVRPSNVAEWSMIATQFREPAFNESCDRVIRHWVERVNEVKSYIEG